MPTKRVKGKKKLKSIKAKQTDAMGSTRRAAKFGKEQRRGLRGSAANYITRSQALKRLQVTLKDFRRLCILKGIYPREPKKKPAGKDKTYYYVKDVHFLAHEPVLARFRAFKTFMKKIKKAMGKKDYATAHHLHAHRPTYDVAHLVKERYPKFGDALSDLDDALCLVHLFARLPTGHGIAASVTGQCLRLVREWQNYIVATHALTKVFVSIKGIYYQACVETETVTWLVPHHFTPTMDKRVDVRVMLTFLEFYTVLLPFVHAQLYQRRGMVYPPKINLHLDEAGVQLAALELEPVQKEDAKPCDEDLAVETIISTQQKASEKRIKTLSTVHPAPAVNDVDSDDDSGTLDEQVEPLEAAFASNDMATQLYQTECTAARPTCLFTGLTFFLSREVPLACLELVLKAHGATLGWDGPGSPLAEHAPCITHHVVDRPHQGHRYFGREYVQPQWVLDSVNNGLLLPLTRYVPGAALPPHLSPFVNDEQEGYTPEYRQELNRLTSAAQVLREVNALGPDAAGEAEPTEATEATYAAEFKAEVDGNEASSDGEDKDDDDAIKRVDDAIEREAWRPVKKEDEATELKELAKTMMSKKAKRLYDRMQYGLGKKAHAIETLHAKRIKLQAEKEQANTAGNEQHE